MQNQINLSSDLLAETNLLQLVADAEMWNGVSGLLMGLSCSCTSPGLLRWLKPQPTVRRFVFFYGLQSVIVA